MPDISLALSTEVAEAYPLVVDGQEYHMLTMDHLSPNDEAEVAALFARFNWLLMELAETPNPEKGTVTAEKIRATRLAIIGKLTDLPRDLREKLPLSQQALLLEKLKEIIDPKPDEDEAGTLEDRDDVTGDGTSIE